MAAVDRLAIAEYMQGKHALITGVRSAPTRRPGSLATVNLPCIWTIAGGRPRLREAGRSGPLWGMLTMQVWIYGRPLLLGDGYDEGPDQLVDLIDPVAQYWFDTDPYVGGNCQGVLSVSDTGWAVAEYNGIPHSSARLDVVMRVGG